MMLLQSKIINRFLNAIDVYALRSKLLPKITQP